MVSPLVLSLTLFPFSIPVSLLNFGHYYHSSHVLFMVSSSVYECLNIIPFLCKNVYNTSSEDTVPSR